MSVQIVGVDPGLVHTGCVAMSFDTEGRRITRKFLVVDGLDMSTVAKWVQEAPITSVFVEKYRPRHSLSPDQDMLDAQRELKRMLPDAVLVDNTGVIKVVPRGLLELLGLWAGPQRTHHDDLRSAARILIKGMMMDDRLNVLLADVVQAHLMGKGWEIGAWNA